MRAILLFPPDWLTPAHIIPRTSTPLRSPRSLLMAKISFPSLLLSVLLGNPPGIWARPTPMPQTLCRPWKILLVRSPFFTFLHNIFDPRSIRVPHPLALSSFSIGPLTHAIQVNISSPLAEGTSDGSASDVWAPMLQARVLPSP